MYCIYCGSQIPDNSAFCTACGKQLTNPSGQPAPPRQPDPCLQPEPPVQHTPPAGERLQGGYRPQYQQTTATPPVAPPQNVPQSNYAPAYQYTVPQQNVPQPPSNPPAMEKRQPVYRNGRLDYGCPMGWYKYQIYFSILSSALMYLFLGGVLLFLTTFATTSPNSFSFGFYNNDESVVFLVLMLPGILGALSLAGLLSTFLGSVALFSLVGAFFQAMTGSKDMALLAGVLFLVLGILILITWVKMLRLQKGAWYWHLIMLIIPVILQALFLVYFYTEASRYGIHAILEQYIIPMLVGIAINVVSIILQAVYFKKRDDLFVN